MLMRFKQEAKVLFGKNTRIHTIQGTLLSNIRSLYWTTNSRRKTELVVQIEALYTLKKSTLDCVKSLFSKHIWLGVENSQILLSEAQCCYFKRRIDASHPLQAVG